MVVFSRSVVTLITFSLLLISLTAMAAPPYLKLGSMELPPYGWINNEGERCGIVYQLNEQLAKRYGTHYFNEIIPFSRMYEMLKSGQIDLISSQPHDEALDAGEKLAIIQTNHIIAATKQGVILHSVDDLKGKTVLYHSGASYPRLDAIAGSIHYVPNYQTSLAMLHKLEGVDAAIFSEPAYYYWMGKLGFTPPDFGKPVLIEADRPQWVFVNRKLSDETKQQIKTIVDALYQEGLYDQMVARLRDGADPDTCNLLSPTPGTSQQTQ